MPNNEHVILIHGLARTHRSWYRMHRALKRSGYPITNLAYPSRQQGIETLANHYLHEAIEMCKKNGAGKIHFVTHSMGGILVRYYLASRTLEQLGHVVMLSPPNQGSELVDKLSALPGFKQVNGPAGYQLGTAPSSLVNQLGPVDYSVGVITGNRSVNPFLSWLIPGDDDGKVSVERARLPGMRDFLVVPSTHPFITQNQRVIHHTRQYLMTGSFSTTVTIKHLQNDQCP